MKNGLTFVATNGLYLLLSMISVSDFLETQTLQISPTALRQVVYYFVGQAFRLLVLKILRRGGLNF